MARNFVADAHLLLCTWRVLEPSRPAMVALPLICIALGGEGPVVLKVRTKDLARYVRLRSVGLCLPRGLLCGPWLSGCLSGEPLLHVEI